MKTLRDRVNYAARVIQRGSSTSRRFDGCFEEGDGDLVVAALVMRSRNNPAMRAALPRYISQSSIDKFSSTDRTP